MQPFRNLLPGPVISGTWSPTDGGPISVVEGLGNTSSKKHRDSGATISNVSGPGVEPTTFHADSDEINHYVKGSNTIRYWKYRGIAINHIQGLNDSFM